MIEITADNLKIAYKKLKSYIYYYSSSNYLKEKLFKFESWKNIEEYNNKFFSIETFFKSRLNDAINNDLFRNSGGVNYVLYPKKDSIKEKDENLIVDSFNVFIDLDFEYYLIDTLFALAINYQYKDSINTDYSYGNPIDKKAYVDINSDDELADNILFVSQSYITI